MTSHAVRAEMLADLFLCRGMTAAECAQIARVASVAEFQAGEVVLEQGKRAQNLWVVLSGTCVAFRSLPDKRDGQVEVVLAELAVGSSFGEMSFFTGSDHSASVRAQSPVRLLRIERPQFDRLVEEGSGGALKLTLNTVATMADRLRRMDDWVVELVSRTSPQKDQPEWARFRRKLFGTWDTV